MQQTAVCEESIEIKPLKIEPRTDAKASGSRKVRSGEMLAMFLLAPTVLALVIRPGMLFPAIWLLGGVAVWLLLRDSTFKRGVLWNAAGVRDGLGMMLARFAFFATLLALLLWALDPGRLVWLFDSARLLDLPRKKPGTWGLIMIGYPVLSVFPQEVAFRAFFMHRYAGVFRHGWMLVAANTAAFGFAHVILHNWWAVGFTALGGLFFSTTYLRTRSLAAVCLEHTLYGCFLFTIGWGWYFYEGALGK